MITAVQRTGPAILSAGGMVIVVMLVLSVADYNATRSLYGQGRANSYIPLADRTACPVVPDTVFCPVEMLNVTEDTDAVAVVVSEESGQMSVVERARIVRVPSEAQVLGLRPAAQLAPKRALRVASRWRRPRPPVEGRSPASRRPVGDRRARPVRRSASRGRGRP